MDKNALSSAKKASLSGIVMALYIVIMLFTRSFAFGEYQIRIATALYSLSAVYPFMIVPLALSNMISNMLLGSLGIFDVIGGVAVGIITTSAVYLIKRFGLNDWFILLPLIFGPGLIVPIWLSYILHVPYMVLAISLCIGQIIPAIVGVMLVKILKKERYNLKGE